MRVPHVSADAAPFRSTSVFSLLSSHGLGVSCDDLALLSALISRRARHRFSSAATFARGTRDAGLGGLKKCPRPHSELLENVMTGASTRIWAAFLRKSFKRRGVSLASCKSTGVALRQPVCAAHLPIAACPFPGATGAFGCSLYKTRISLYARVSESCHAVIRKTT